MLKLSKITVACTKTGQFWEKGQFWVTQSQQNDCKFWTVETQQNDQFGNLYISSHGEARNIKFVQHVNPIQKVSLGTRPQELVMSLPHNHTTLTNLFISSYRDYYYQIWSVKTFFSIWFFFSQTFMIQRTAVEGEGNFFKSSPPLLPASQTLRH